MQVSLQGGQEYDLRIEYYEGTGSATMQLMWLPPGSSLPAPVVIPKGQLLPPPAAPPGPPPSSPDTIETLVYLHTDHLGSISVATNASGQVVSQQRYDPWGKTIYTNGQSPTKLDYTGQRKDDTGLLYYRARYYDPGLGRFVSPDSIVPDATRGAEKNSKLTVDFHEVSLISAANGENALTLNKGFWFELSGAERQKARKPWGPSNPQALNRYAYVLNNPLRYTDPSGHVGHEGEVVNHSSYPIIVVGVKDGEGVVAVVWPGESSRKYMPDADFWRPIDGDPLKWMKVGANVITVENSSNPGSSSGLQYKSRCTGWLCSDSGPWEWGEGPFGYVTCGATESDCRKYRPRSCGAFGWFCNDNNDWEEYPWYQMRGCDRSKTTTWCTFEESSEYRRAIEENSRTKKERGGGR